MKAYLLVRDSIPYANAVHAAAVRTDLPELVDWLTGGAEMQYCRLDDREFERVRCYQDAIVLSSERHEGEEVAIAFGPRSKWPEEFGRFRDLIAEAAKQQEERENITEEKWLAWDSRPFDLANFALRRASRRKIRLFAVAWCDLVADRIIDERSRRAVELALRHADGAASDEELSAGIREAQEALWTIMRRRGGAGLDQSSPEYGAAALACAAVQELDRTPTPDMPDGWFSQCAGGTTSDFLLIHALQAAHGEPSPEVRLTGLLREICGNPFRGVVIAPECQAPEVTALARSIYDTKAFDQLPRLADALEAAGCRDLSILDHCHLPVPHVRGCWVLDLVLGYEPEIADVPEPVERSYFYL